MPASCAEVEKRFGYRLGGVALAGAARVLAARHAPRPRAGRGPLRAGRRRGAWRAPDRRPRSESGAPGCRCARRGRRRRGPPRPRHRLATVLERYERWRRLDSALSAATFDALNRLFSNDLTLLRSARDFGLGLVERLPVLEAVLRRRSRRPHRRRAASAARRAGLIAIRDYTAASARSPRSWTRQLHA